MKKIIYLFLTIFLVVCCDSKPKNPIYLDANGITIKAHKWAKVGDEGIVNDVLYTIVDKQMLVSLIKEGNSYDRTCTTFIYNMDNLFTGKTTSQNISHWDVSNVESMKSMFYASPFNSDISNWDVSNVISMSSMFNRATSFNQDISNWDVSNVNRMGSMFYYATSFNQDLSSWSVDGLTACYNFSRGATSWTLPQPSFINCYP
jgi:surface protein